MNFKNFKFDLSNKNKNLIPQVLTVLFILLLIIYFTINAQNNMGNVLGSQGKFEQAIKAYDAAFGMNADFFSAYSSAAHLRAKICNWRGDDHKLIDDYVTKGLKTTLDHPLIPFQNLHIEDSPKNHLELAKIFASATTKIAEPYVFRKSPSKPKKLRVGYFSPDFNNHPVAQMVEGVLRHHDRNKFEIFAYSFVNKADHQMRNKIENAVDHFRDVDERLEELEDRLEKLEDAD